MGVYERIGRNIKRVHAALEHLKCRLKLFSTPDFEEGSIEALVARCRVNFGHVHHTSGIANIPHDRQSAHIEYSLAQDFETLGRRRVCRSGSNPPRMIALRPAARPTGQARRGWSTPE